MRRHADAALGVVAVGDHLLVREYSIRGIEEVRRACVAERLAVAELAPQRLCAKQRRFEECTVPDEQCIAALRPVFSP